VLSPERSKMSRHRKPDTAKRKRGRGNTSATKQPAGCRPREVPPVTPGRRMAGGSGRGSARSAAGARWRRQRLPPPSRRRRPPVAPAGRRRRAEARRSPSFAAAFLRSGRRHACARQQQEDDAAVTAAGEWCQHGMRQHQPLLPEKRRGRAAREQVVSAAEAHVVLRQ